MNCPPTGDNSSGQGQNDWQGGGQRQEVRSRPFIPPQDRLEAIYIGHIARDLSDELLKKVLLQCGTITRWTRTRDPRTDAPTTFGFCEFESPEAVWRVTKLIDGLSLGGSCLMVTCPQKTKELMEKWHSQRLFFLQKANPHWSSDQVEEEFLQDDQRVLVIIKKIVEDIEEAIKRNRTEREADEKAKATRLAAVRQRLNDRREPTDSKKQRLGDGSSVPRGQRQDGDHRERKKKQSVGGIPAYIANKQTHRVETVKARIREMDAEFERKAARWAVDVDHLIADAHKRWKRFEDLVVDSLPGRRTALQMIEADLREVNYVLSLPYLQSCGRNPLYIFNVRDLIESTPQELDENKIPLDKPSQKRVLVERKRMRDNEKRDDAQDAKEGENEKLEAEARVARKMALKLRLQQRARAEAERAAAAAADEPNLPPVPTDETPRIPSSSPGGGMESVSIDSLTIDWQQLAANKYFEPENPFRGWLIKRMTDYVGATDSEELAEYILDLLPPKSASVPTRGSLTKELIEFLDDETESFVDEMWERLAGGT